MNSTEFPADGEDDSGTMGTVTLDLSTMPLNGIASRYLDTLHSDYAFPQQQGLRNHVMFIIPQPVSSHRAT